MDTVGFIRKLPHEVVEAFHATLEEARLADVLVLVSDGADPQLLSRRHTVGEVLDSLGAVDAPRIDALNKCDLLSPSADVLPGALPISAATGQGLDELLTAIEDALDAGTEEVSLLVSFARLCPDGQAAPPWQRPFAGTHRRGRGAALAGRKGKCGLRPPGRGCTP